MPGFVFTKTIQATIWAETTGVTLINDYLQFFFIKYYRLATYNVQQTHGDFYLISHLFSTYDMHILAIEKTFIRSSLYYIMSSRYP